MLSAGDDLELAAEPSLVEADEVDPRGGRQGGLLAVGVPVVVVVVAVGPDHDGGSEVAVAPATAPGAIDAHPRAIAATRAFTRSNPTEFGASESR